MPYVVSNDVIIWHENETELSIRIFACMPYWISVTVVLR